jgi:hypothetical protein
MCFLDSDLKLSDVIAKGEIMMENYNVKVNDSF